MARANGRTSAKPLLQKKTHRAHTRLAFPEQYETIAKRSKRSKSDAEAKRLLQDLNRMSSDLGAIIASAKSIALRLEDINKASAAFWKDYGKLRQ